MFSCQLKYIHRPIARLKLLWVVAAMPLNHQICQNHFASLENCPVPSIGIIVQS
jgi:hypothetical protein